MRYSILKLDFLPPFCATRQLLRSCYSRIYQVKIMELFSAVNQSIKLFFLVIFRFQFWLFHEIFNFKVGFFPSISCNSRTLRMYCSQICQAKIMKQFPVIEYTEVKTLEKLDIFKRPFGEAAEFQKLDFDLDWSRVAAKMPVEKPTMEFVNACCS